jgi:hypothetical protein
VPTIVRGPYAIYHIPSEKVPLKSEIFTKNVKEWPIEILNVNRKCPIIKILIPITELGGCVRYVTSAC